MDLFTTLDPPAPYQVVAVADPATAGWLHLPTLHAQLLPLARAAGHEKLLLTVQIGDGLPYYEADATGGPSGFRRYIGLFDSGSTPNQFEKTLRTLLEQQAAYHALVKEAA